jgi:hypothetical protein
MNGVRKKIKPCINLEIAIEIHLPPGGRGAPMAAPYLSAAQLREFQAEGAVHLLLAHPIRVLSAGQPL